MLRILHAADLHLDSPFAALPPEQAAARRGEQRELLERLCALARSERADLVLLSGDLLDSERVFRETAQTLAGALGSLPCPVCIAPGNHDFYTPRSVYATLNWPDNVRIFRSRAMERVDLPALGCAVYGRAFDAPQDGAPPLRGFHAERRGGERLLMCLHGDVTLGESAYGPVAARDIAESGLDYLALGHIHQGSGLRREGNTFWAYPGCPEGRNFRETGTKGALLVEAEPGGARARFLPLSRRRYLDIRVDLAAGEDPLAAVRAALPEGAERDVCRVTLAGLRGAPDLAALRRGLAGRVYGLVLRDETRPPEDLWRRAREDSLTGRFLRGLEERCRSGDPAALLAVRFGLAALERGEDPAP